LRDQYNIRLDRVPLVRSIRGVDLDSYAEPSFSQPAVRKPTLKASDLERDVLRHKNQTVVTPRVGRIAQGLFELTLRVAGQSSADDNDGNDDDLVQAINQAKIHHQDPVSVQWVEPADSAGHYNSVVMDEVVYSVKTLMMFTTP
jgi:DNA (cytosine-5)-methyltransferase 1